MIKAKALSADEIGKIEDEWEDSTVVKKLLGHIRYLTDTIIQGRSLPAEGDGDGTG